MRYRRHHRREQVSDRLFQGLRRLEYRGYDSAGICILVDDALVRRRAEGKLDNLGRVLADDPLAGTVGIAHTRWATHGAPTLGNAHAHIVGGVALVHNGIIENFRPLREEMQKLGRVATINAGYSISRRYQPVPTPRRRQGPPLLHR